MYRIGIIGAGALGAMYGEIIRRRPEMELFYIASGERAERLRQEGLVVNGEQFLPNVENPPLETSAAALLPAKDLTNHGSSPRPAHLIIYALKHHHLSEGLRMAAPFVGSDTVHVSVMNGVESEHSIGECFGHAHVLYAVALGMDALREDNRLTYTTPGKTLIGRGENRGAPDSDLRLVQDIFTKTGIIWETPEDMKHSMWYKFMINVGVNQVSALLRAPFRVFQNNEHARILMEKAMEEVITVSKKEQIALDNSDISAWYEIMNTLSPDGKTSMLQDIEAGRKTEVEMFAGYMMKKGKEYNIFLPVNELLLHAIKVMESDLLSGS